MYTFLLVLAFVSSAFAGILRIEAKVGQKVEVNFGGKTETIMRETKDGRQQLIKVCSPEAKEPWCNQFFDAEDNKAVKSSAHIDANGVLVFDSVQKSDAGRYTSPEHGPMVSLADDGSKKVVAGPMIKLTVE
ncbi:hypothetical protein GCK32_018865 [Trichostrongylus colubriformis]|uniref:Uncharacterized protein n=1 Tax=Trichostrongylus colubriformis TaxID=6319 RepID=A0AAN8F304_TRICO